MADYFDPTREKKRIENNGKKKNLDEEAAIQSGLEVVVDRLKRRDSISRTNPRLWTFSLPNLQNHCHREDTANKQKAPKRKKVESSNQKETEKTCEDLSASDHSSHRTSPRVFSFRGMEEQDIENNLELAHQLQQQKLRGPPLNSNT